MDTDQKRTPAARTAGWGLLKRQEVWTLSRRGWIILLALCLTCGILVIWRFHPFLAVTKRVDAEYMVVEAWVPNYALEASIAEFKAKPYRFMFVVGGDSLSGINVEEGDNLADYAVSRLKWLGMDAKSMQSVPAHVKYRNRTYESAVALRHWIEAQHLPVASFNVVTVGAHARRSRLLFEKAFKGRARVGVIAVEDREYDPDRWWKYSEGVKQIATEGMAYFYVRFAFWP